ncbi:energy-coupling factor transporter transmembrane component T family protein [Ligilactobacillus sp. LYQ112]|uniref:energy-coupling factor transporter transmembrane component T family protein n=1 Tax=Ligilactobacillus sp. LYQ112 TaxID=3391060 RepID=UPI0039834920
MTKLLLGRYVSGNSILHRMDARAKLALSFAFIAIIFLANNWATYLVLSAFTLGCVVLSRVSVRFFIAGVKPLVWLILLTVTLQVFFARGGTVYWHWGVLFLTAGGITNGIFVFCRFMLIICMSTLLTLTTPPLAIADAMESLMTPLKLMRVPVAEIALMLSIALRFVPTLMDETQKIMNAQRARGVSFSTGKVRDRIKAIIPLLVPLFVSSFERAEDLATAMEARGYRDGAHRTKYRIQQWHLVDTVAVVAFVLLTGALVWLRA